MYIDEARSYGSLSKAPYCAQDKMLASPERSRTDEALALRVVRLGLSAELAYSGAIACSLEGLPKTACSDGISWIGLPYRVYFIRIGYRTAGEQVTCTLTDCTLQYRIVLVSGVSILHQRDGKPP